MKNIDLLYKNELGIAFKWKENELTSLEEVNFVFKSTGMHLTEKEIIIFNKQIRLAIANISNFKDCIRNTHCKPILLESPVTQVSFILSSKELKLMQELLCSANFYLSLKNILRGFSIKNSF